MISYYNWCLYFYRALKTKSIQQHCIFAFMLVQSGVAPWLSNISVLCSWYACTCLGLFPWLSELSKIFVSPSILFEKRFSFLLAIFWLSIVSDKSRFWFFIMFNCLSIVGDKSLLLFITNCICLITGKSYLLNIYFVSSAMLRVRIPKRMPLFSKFCCSEGITKPELLKS